MISIVYIIKFLKAVVQISAKTIRYELSSVQLNRKISRSKT